MLQCLYALSWLPTGGWERISIILLNSYVVLSSFLYATSVLCVFVKVFSLQLSPAELIKQHHISSKLEHIVSFSSLRKVSTKPGHSSYGNCSFSVMQHLCYNHIYSMAVGWRVTTQLFIKWNRWKSYTVWIMAWCFLDVLCRVTGYLNFIFICSVLLLLYICILLYISI